VCESLAGHDQRMWLAFSVEAMSFTPRSYTLTVPKFCGLAEVVAGGGPFDRGPIRLLAINRCCMSSFCLRRDPCSLRAKPVKTTSSAPTI
jgi:hypothetical protein